MKTILSMVVAILVLPSLASAFEPIPVGEVQGLVNSKIYAGRTVLLQDKDNVGKSIWVYAGEPITLVSAEVKEYTRNKLWKGESQTVQGRQVRDLVGRTEAGQTVAGIHLQDFSRAPLAYSLRDPKSYDALVKAVLAEMEAYPSKMNALLRPFDYDLHSESLEPEVDPKILTDKADLVKGLQDCFQFDKKLLRDLVLGNRVTEADMAGNQAEHAWLLAVKDTQIRDRFKKRDERSPQAKKYGPLLKKIEAREKVLGLFLDLRDVTKDLALIEYNGEQEKKKDKVAELTARRQKKQAELDKLLKP